MTNWSHDAMISAKFITPHSPRMTNWSTTRQINGKLGFLVGAKWFFYKSDRNEQIWCKSSEKNMKHTLLKQVPPFGKIKIKLNGPTPQCPDASEGDFLTRCFMTRCLRVAFGCPRCPRCPHHNHSSIRSQRRTSWFWLKGKFFCYKNYNHSSTPGLGQYWCTDFIKHHQNDLQPI